MKRKILLAIFTLSATGCLFTQVAAWDFYGQSFPVSCAATTFHPGLVSGNGANLVIRGAGAPASGGMHSFRTTGFQNNGLSLENTDYFQVTLGALPGYKLSLSAIDAKFNGTASFFAVPGVTSQFAYSLDGVVFHWIGAPVQTSALTMTQVSLAGIPDLQNLYCGTVVTLRYYASGQTSTGGWGFYSASSGTNGLSIGGSVEPATVVPPTIQASSISFNNIQPTGMSVSWTPGNGERRLVKISTTGVFTDPVNGTDPPANPVYAGQGEQVICNSWGNLVPLVSGLQPGVLYHFRVYEYNGTGALTMYNTATSGGNPSSQQTSAFFNPPVVVTTNPAFIGDTSAVVGGSVITDGGSAITARGTVWSLLSPVSLNDHLLAEGGTDTGSFFHTRTGLPAETKIFFSAFAVNSADTSLADEGSFYTHSAEPSEHVTNFTASASGTTTVGLSWTLPAAGADGFLVLRKDGVAATLVSPCDGAWYTAGSSLGDATVAGQLADSLATALAVEGLLPGHTYTFTIYPFNWDGIHPETTNYRTGPLVPSATATTLVPAAGEYHWTGSSGNSWTTPANWNPPRDIPSPNDILIFDGGMTSVINDVPVQTTGQIRVLNSTSVTLQGGGVLTVEGGTGEDFVVESGSQLNMAGAAPVTISLLATATGTISGIVSLAGGGHRLISAAAPGIIFQGGSLFRAGQGFTGNPFGTTSLGSVRFSAGSIYAGMAGGNPFGAAAPSSVVVFQPGSLYRIDAYCVPSFGGRVYGNFEMNYPGTITVTGSSAVSIDHFTVTQGTFYFNMTGNPGHSIKGNIFVGPPATLIISPSSAGTILLNDSSAQVISGTGSISAGQHSTLQIANAGGVTLQADASFNNLTIQQGALFTIAPGVALTVNGDLVNGAPATGFVLESEGSLIHHTQNVNATIRRNIAAATWSDWQDGWHFLSSPVTGQPISSAGGFVTTGAGNDFDLYAWQETTGEWINYKNSTTPPTFASVNGGPGFVTGRGYMVAYQQAGIKEFSGSIRVYDVVIEGLTGNGAGNGWHLLGNPFPSSLSWYSGWNAVNIGGVAMIWNEQGRSYTPLLAGDPIPALNGFMVQVTGVQGSPGALTIPASGRLHANQPWYKENNSSFMRLFARNMEDLSYQECRVRIDEKAGLEFDPASDGRFLKGFAPQLYAMKGSEQLAVITIPTPSPGTERDLGFIGNRGSHYRLDAEIPPDFPATVHLCDLKTKESHNLAEVSRYEFIAGEEDPAGRFRLRFSHVGGEEIPAERAEIYACGNQVCLRTAGSAEMEVVSADGRRVMWRRLDSPGFFRTPEQFATGCYLVRLTTPGDVVVKKIFIHA